MAELDLQEVYDTLVNLALEAGKMIQHADISSAQVKKNTADPVTETDKAIEAYITRILTTKFPSAIILGEETHDPATKTTLTPHPTFIIDPIDGTTNLLHGFPFTCVSLGFCLAAHPTIGVVHNPTTGALYSARQHHGAFLRNSRDPADTPPLRLPLRSPAPALHGLSSALVAIEWGSDRSGPNWDARLAFFAQLGGAKAAGGAMARGLRSTGSAAMNLCLVAAGQLDAAWEAGAWAWDVCAGWAILEEAGGRVVDLRVPAERRGTWAEMAPRVDGRTFFGVRAAAEEEQRGLVEELWRIEAGEFRYG